jgi:hypothetical protein
VRWEGQGEIRSGDYTIYYSRGEKWERGVAIVVHKSIKKNKIKIKTRNTWKVLKCDAREGWRR